MKTLLNPRLWIWLGGLLLVCAVVGVIYRAGGASAREELANYRSTQTEAGRVAALAREKRAADRQTELNLVVNDGQKQIDEMERQRDAARADGDRMRLDLDRAAKRARELARAAAAGPGQPDPDPIGVFAGLLDRADRRAEAVSGYADRLRVAGLVCERAWDKVRAPATVKLFP